jgi:hypothetical protein
MIHEEFVARHFAVDPLSPTRERVPDPALSALHGAMLAARQAAERAHTLAEAVMRNEMLTIPARHRQAKEQGWKLIEGASRKIDAARATALAELERLRAATVPPRPRDTAGLLLAGEVRARLAGMSREARRDLLNAALLRADDVVVGAALGGPAMLSGMDDPGELEDLRERWRLARFPAEVDRIARLERAVADVERGGSQLVRFGTMLADPEVIARAEASERQAQAAMAG